jgi:RNA polymerase sigma-70 factor (ECF subfamily)
LRVVLHSSGQAGQSATPSDTPRQLDVQRIPDHLDRLYRAAYALCRSREEADDLVQETIERVLRRPRFLRRDDDLGYLMRALRNTWINAHHERERRPKTVELDETVEFVVDPDADPAVSATDRRTIYSAVADLKPNLRETIVAVDVVGLSYRQAATALGVRQGTIMSRLFRARNEVAEQLECAGLRPSAPDSDRRHTGQ